MFKTNMFSIPAKIYLLIFCVVALLPFGAACQIETNGTIYTIINKSTNLVWNVKDNSSSAGASIWQYHINASNPQQFTFEDAGGGYYYIRTKAGLYVTAKQTMAVAVHPDMEPPINPLAPLSNVSIKQERKYQPPATPQPMVNPKDPKYQKWKLVKSQSQWDSGDFLHLVNAGFPRHVLKAAGDRNGDRLVLISSQGSLAEDWFIFKKRLPNQGQSTTLPTQWRAQTYYDNGAIYWRSGIPIQKDNHNFHLYNTVKQKYLTKNTGGASGLAWASSSAVNGMTTIYRDIEKGPGGLNAVLKYGDTVSFYFNAGAAPHYLNHYNNVSGIDLRFSDIRSGQWVIGGNTNGIPVLHGDNISLLNINSNSKLIQCNWQTSGIDLQWEAECMAPQPQGFSKFEISNCHNDEISVNLWTYDLTTGDWKDHGLFAAQWSDGNCPGNNPPKSISLTNGHRYQLIALNNVNGCIGRPDRVNGSCRKLETPIVPATTNGNPYIVRID